MDSNSEEKSDTKKDEKRELKDTQQEMMLELKIKTVKLFRKLKEQNKKDRVRM